MALFPVGMTFAVVRRVLPESPLSRATARGAPTACNQWGRRLRRLPR